ncbi:hypothetical protein DID88_005329 [Monilinia fructigena]|uniref:Pre-mRNA-splicing factor cef1 n=1 Tax=Monilinia fructigena TaxID=38457 RepID=A0A395J0R0_9HELO|nr:hypothetical protein DID88_005329 [Monilinia fructigena]
MNHLCTFGILLLGAVQSIHCLPEALKHRSQTCAPSLITTTYISTISTVKTVPHSCYTRTLTTTQSSFPCSGTKTFNPATCGPVPLCILLSTTTITVPPSDTCCKATPTITVPGACAQCQTGCATDLSTVTVTAGATPLSYNPGGPQLPPTKRHRSTEIPCISTLSRFKQFILGPTKTIFPSTVTATSSVDCAGCDTLSIEYIGASMRLDANQRQGKTKSTTPRANMPVVKGGVWTNIEDEILKASVSKYGLNQWARVSSLLARKTPKQCKARWSEWLDPGIRKIEWSKEEDEKLLHLAKLMPTQWRTIAPIVGRTATQCLERYQKLLDEAEQKEAGEFGLGGPDGGETKAPSADDVRRLRPGEVDPDPESKPARPDTVDLDEDEKEMLSEARARLANTQGKKAKRKARERQLEESRRLAVLQKRRELKTAGINIKVVNKKKGMMDYNADIPFEKAPAPGFYDTGDESIQNEKQRAAFDPRKQQLAIKRKGEQDDNPDQKRHKNDKNAPSASYQAAMKAGQMQKIREAEQSSKRRALVLPAPQVGEGELEEIVKMGMIGERANIMARSSENDATRGLVNTYSTVNSGAPIRTPRAPAQEDHIANEIRNIRALTETQSSLLGGENTPLHEGSGSTGFDGVTPRRQQMETPNPMATPFRANGISSTPIRNGVGATPMRTPRDSFALNADGEMELVGRTPQDLKLRGMTLKNSLRAGLASLPKPKDTEWELELPEEQQENLSVQELSEEDAELRDRRNRQIREAQEQLEFKRQTQVLQEGSIEREAALLIANDALKYPTPGAKVKGTTKAIEVFEDDALSQARLQLLIEVPRDLVEQGSDAFRTAWDDAHKSSLLPGLSGYDSDDEIDEHQMLLDAFDNVQKSIVATAEKGNKSEKKLALHLGGYQQRAKMLRQKIGEAADALSKANYSLDAFKTLQISEDVAILRRLEDLRERVGFVSKREREAQELYRQRKEELTELTNGLNGLH